MKKVIVTGGRNYADRETVNEVLDTFCPVVIIQGGATGADFLAREYAKEKDILLITYDADWKKHGRLAGPIRNELMLSDHKDATVIAFKGGKGTANCIAKAMQFNMKVWKVLNRPSWILDDGTERKES